MEVIAKAHSVSLRPVCWIRGQLFSTSAHAKPPEMTFAIGSEVIAKLSNSTL